MVDFVDLNITDEFGRSIDFGLNEIWWLGEIHHVGLALDPETNDIFVNRDGDLAFVVNAEAVAQHARQRIMTFEGEWFLDTRAGMTWLTDVLGRRYDPALAEALVKAEIMGTDGVTEITSFSIRFDRKERRITAFNIEIGTRYGGEIKL